MIESIEKREMAGLSQPSGVCFSELRYYRYFSFIKWLLSLEQYFLPDKVKFHEPDFDSK
jgi:hypothetical protein